MIKTWLGERLKEQLFRHVMGSHAFKYRVAIETLKSVQFDAFGIFFELAQAGPLGQRGDRVYMPLDFEIFPVVQQTGTWDPHLVECFSRMVARFDGGDLIDVGANCGLFTRQMLSRCPGLIESALCIEPHPRNFGCLELNLAKMPNVRLFQLALGAENGSLPFFEDIQNAGNYSLLKSSVRAAHVRETHVNMRRVSDFFSEVRPANGNLFWKSDTQGFDQLIVALMPDEIWSRVRVAAIELRPLAGIERYLDGFVDKLRNFDLEIVGGGKITIDEIRAFLTSGGRGEKDLIGQVRP